MLKAAIVILFIGVVASLSSGLVYLIKDMGVPESKRTLYALGLRIGLAASLMGLIAYGIQTGRLGNTAPWGGRATIDADLGILPHGRVVCSGCQFSQSSQRPYRAAQQ